MNRVSAPVAPPSRTTTSRLMVSSYSSYLARSWPSSASPDTLDYSLQVYLPTRLFKASTFASSRPPTASLNLLYHGLQVNLQCFSITASRCIFKLARSRPLSASPNSLNYSLQLYLQARSIMASECISKFTRSQCGEMVELEGRQPIVDTLPHLTWYLKRIDEQEQF